ncbi:MAG: hypothetical protein E7307_01555 [Butyrivibrio sp.]|nr:hypothetical protein [Butyrivibrio sp.]
MDNQGNTTENIIPDSNTSMPMELTIPTVKFPPEIYENISSSLEGISNAVSSIMSNIDLSGMTAAIETVASYTAASLPDTSVIASSLQTAYESIQATSSIIDETVQPIKASSSILLDACAPLVGTTAFNDLVLIDDIETCIHPVMIEAMSGLISVYSGIEGKILELVRTIEKKFSFCHEIIHKAYHIVQKWLKEKISGAIEHTFYSLRHLLRFYTRPPRIVLHYDIRADKLSPELKNARKKFMGIAPRIKEQFLRHSRERGNDSDLPDYVAICTNST